MQRPSKESDRFNIIEKELRLQTRYHRLASWIPAPVSNFFRWREGVHFNNAQNASNTAEGR